MQSLSPLTRAAAASAGLSGGPDEPGLPPVERRIERALLHAELVARHPRMWQVIPYPCPQPPLFPRRRDRHQRQVSGAARRNHRCLSLGAGRDLPKRAKRRACAAGRRGDPSSGISRRAREVPRWPTPESHGHTSVLFSGGLGRSRLPDRLCRTDSRPDRSVPAQHCDPAVVHSDDILRRSQGRENHHDCRQRGIAHHHALWRHTGTGLLLEALTASTATTRQRANKPALVEFS